MRHSSFLPQPEQTETDQSAMGYSLIQPFRGWQLAVIGHVVRKPTNDSNTCT